MSKERRKLTLSTVSSTRSVARGAAIAALPVTCHEALARVRAVGCAQLAPRLTASVSTLRIAWHGISRAHYNSRLRLTSTATTAAAAGSAGLGHASSKAALCELPSRVLEHCSLLDLDSSTVHLGLVHRLNGILGIALLSEGDEAESL